MTQACAVDPGSVATAIYRDSKLFSRQPLKWLIQNLYAPPWDGAAAVVHAASAPSWGPPARPTGECDSHLKQVVGAVPFSDLSTPPWTGAAAVLHAAVRLHLPRCLLPEVSERLQIYQFHG